LSYLKSRRTSSVWPGATTTSKRAGRCTPRFPCWPPGSLTVSASFTSHDTPRRRLYLSCRTNTWPGGPPHALTRLAVLRPTDPNVFQPHYAQGWHQLSSYEKCLFWWTEVHMLGLEFPTWRPEIPLVRVQSERLLAGDRTELSNMLELMELDWDERWVARAGRLIDRWHHQTDRTFDPHRISRVN
jgi:hypothetical protein